MFRDRLAELFRESAFELATEAEILEKAQMIVRTAQSSLEELARSAEEGGAARSDSVVSGAVPEEVVADSHAPAGESGREVSNGLAPTGLGIGDSCSKIEEALLMAGVTKQDGMIEMIRVVAQANQGLVSPGETAPVLLKLGLSKSKPRNLPGYMLHEMNRSKEFVRVGQQGSGRYRWRPYEGLATGNGPSPENGEGPASVGSEMFEEAAV